MKIADANIILRYLLDDNKVLSDKATEIIENNVIYVPFEVVCEVVYVLQKVYNTPRVDIKNGIVSLFSNQNITTNDIMVLTEAFAVYAERKLDFVDSLLASYSSVNHDVIFSFDKKLNKLLNS